MQDFNDSVSLHISHPAIDPVLITRALGLHPTGRPTRQGESRATPDGRPLEGHWEFSHWHHSFVITQDRELAPFLKRLTDILGPKRAFLQQIVEEGGEVECFVGIFTDTNCDQILPFDLLGKLAELRVDLRLDIYGSKMKQGEPPSFAEGTRTRDFT